MFLEWREYVMLNVSVSGRVSPMRSISCWLPQRPDVERSVATYEWSGLHTDTGRFLPWLLSFKWNIFMSTALNTNQNKEIKSKSVPLYHSGLFLACSHISTDEWYWWHNGSRLHWHIGPMRPVSLILMSHSSRLAVHWHISRSHIPYKPSF